MRWEPPSETNHDVTNSEFQIANGLQVAYGYIKDNLDDALTIEHATAIDRELDRFLKTLSTNDHK